MHKKVLVVGGGIAGIQSALDLGDMGIEVYLVERGPSIGGRMTQLDKTFPTNDCAMCILSPKLVEAGSHPYINIITNAEIREMKGQAGNFQVSVLKKARFVDEKKCTGCGICMNKCPVKIPDEYNKGLSKTKCIRIPFPQAIPAIPIMDKGNCIYHQRGKCRICEKFCEQKAIDFEQKDETVQIEVGSIILATGSEEFDATLKGEYGYRTFPNVLTSIEYERILSASGPTLGHVKRPSDGKETKSIAFVQCVGSRDMQVGNEYCSAICCMQATKDAVVTVEHLSDVRTTIFFMDMRAYGKDFDKFVEKAKDRYKVRFIRARIASVEVNPVNDNLVIRYNTNEGKMVEEEFGLLVLSIGLRSSEEGREAARRFGVTLNDQGFSENSPFRPLATSQPGIFVCGTLSGPRDIPETVMQASGASSEASRLLVNLPVKEIKTEYPPERDVLGEGSRLGVFICRCGINIASTVDVPRVVEYASTLPNVVHAEEMLFACSQDAQKLIRRRIEEKQLNRVVVASCTPRTHEPLFQTTLRASGLNPYLFEFANIREHCSWVHQKEPELATEKARDLVRMSVSKAGLLESLSRKSLGVNKKALIIGGGVAGMTAALELADQGFETYLLEKEPEPGGNLRKVHYTLKGEATGPFLNSLIEKITSHPKIIVYTNAVLKDVSGYVGNFKTMIEVNGKPKTEIEHGVIIVATGGNEYKPDEYLYGEDEGVITQRELEEELKESALVLQCSSAPVDEKLEKGSNGKLEHLKTVVMIQCVGSRDDDRPYCSRICCSEAVKNALQLKKLNPGINIYILYRDVRTYGLKEQYYKKAREEGIIFIRYEQGTEPKIIKSAPVLQCSGAPVNENTETREPLKVSVFEPVLQRELIIAADMVVLSVGIVAPGANKELSQMLKVPLNDEGFFLEAHVKLRPVDFATDGIFVCGLAHYPKDVSESIAQAKAAAGRALTVLSRNEIEAEGKVSRVRKEKCVGCGVCVEVCAYKAIELDPLEKIAVVNEALCKGCGACAASCRPGAIDLKGFTNEQVLAVLDAV